MNWLRGLFRNGKTGNLYFVQGIAKSATDPHKELVVYNQLYSKTGHPEGTMWYRPVGDFEREYEKVYQPRIERFLTTVRTALNQDFITGHNRTI